jgi:hypothetical protein
VYRRVQEELPGEASKRLEAMRRAEEAADQTLLRLGSNLRSFLRDAVSIAPPDDRDGDGDSSRDGDSRDSSRSERVRRPPIHSTRLDAQLHALHATPTTFTQEPRAAGEYASWAAAYDLESQTQRIAKQLDEHAELRAALERLVPGQVAYAAFWTRYHFLRHGLERAEERRRQLAIAASAAPEEVAWESSESVQESVHESVHHESQTGPPKDLSDLDLSDK